MTNALDHQITIGGRTLCLRFSMIALDTLCTEYGLKSISEIGERLADMSQLGPSDLVAIFWAATRSNHPDLTKADILKLLDDAGMDAVGPALSAAMAKGGAGTDADTRPPMGAEAAKAKP